MITEMDMARTVVKAMRILSAPGKPLDIYGIEGIENPEMIREACQGTLEEFAAENPSLCQGGAEELAEAFVHCMNEQIKVESTVDSVKDLSRWLPSRKK